MKMIEITFEYTQAEYVFGVRKHLIASKIIRRYDLALAVVFLVFSVYYMINTSFSMLSIMLFAALIIVAALGCWLYFFAPSYRFKRMSKLHEPYTLIFTSEQIFWKTPSIDSRIQWNIYTQFWRSEQHYFLVQAGHLYTLVPKRAFKSDLDALVFEQIASEKISKPRDV